MISFVKGTVADIGENCLVVENGGIGYEIYMTGQDLGKARIGDEKKIHTFLYVREDILQLYGFFSKDDLGMFKLLIGVNGVGPKGALGILSGISADELRFAVLSDDVKTISKAPGIGKKTAKAIVDTFGTDTFHVLKEPPKHETIPRIKLMAVTATNLASPLFFSSKRIIMPTTYAIYTIFVAMELII